MSSSRYYRARYLGPDGQATERLFFVPTMQDVRREIMQANGVVQSITEHRNNWLNREHYSREYKLAFLKGLSFHVDVGVSAGQGLMQVIEAEPHAVKRAEMQPALEVLARGGRFSDALAALPFMDRTIVVLLQTADAAGSINDAINDAVAIMESRSAAWKMIASAFAWIGFDLFTVVSTVFGVQFYAIPWFNEHPPQVHDADAVANYNSQLKLITTMSQMMTLGTIAIAVLLLAFVLALLWGPPQIKDWLQQRIVRLPLLRSIFIDGALADGFLLLSRMERNGVPLIQALALLASFAWIRAVAGFWRTVQQSLTAGWDVRRAFESAEMLSEQELKILSSHQNREQFAKAMASMAVRRRQEAEQGTARFIRLSVVISIVYMVVVLGMVLWMLSLQNMGLSGSFEELMKGGF